MSISGFIKRHPVTIYYAPVLAISWGSLLIVAGPGRITAEQLQTPRESVHKARKLITFSDCRRKSRSGDW